ncbi:unnamed protein product, partial [Meganyctiphanes norvegica]
VFVNTKQSTCIACIGKDGRVLLGAEELSTHTRISFFSKMGGAKLGKCKNCKNAILILINKDDLCYARCLKEKGNTYQFECQKCKNFISYRGVQCKACQEWFHAEKCCNVTYKMFDNYQILKIAEGMWWFCQNCDIKINAFVQNNLKKQKGESSGMMLSKNDNSDKEDIECINLEQDNEINLNDLHSSKTKNKSELLKLSNPQPVPEEITSDSDDILSNDKNPNGIQNTENVNKNVILQQEDLQSQATNNIVNLKKDLETGEPNELKFNKESTSENERDLQVLSCQSKNSESEEEINISRKWKRKWNNNIVTDRDSEESSSSLPDLSRAMMFDRKQEQSERKQEHMVINSESDTSNNGKKKKRKMLERNKKSLKKIIINKSECESITRNIDINEISESEEEDIYKTPNKYKSKPTNLKPMKRGRRRISSVTSDEGVNEEYSPSEGYSSEEEKQEKEDGREEEEKESEEEETEVSENERTEEVTDEETDNSYESCEDSVRAALNDVKNLVGRSGYDVKPISYLGQGNKCTPKKKKRKPLTLEQRIEKRQYPTGLINRLQKNSVEKKSLKGMLKEWKFHAYQHVDKDNIDAIMEEENFVHEEDTNQCSCKKKALKHLFFVKNIKNPENPLLIVGSECIRWFRDSNSSFLYEKFVEIFTKKHNYTFCNIVELCSIHSKTKILLFIC